MLLYLSVSSAILFVYLNYSLMYLLMSQINEVGHILVFLINHWGSLREVLLYMLEKFPKDSTCGLLAFCIVVIDWWCYFSEYTLLMMPKFQSKAFILNWESWNRDIKCFKSWKKIGLTWSNVSTIWSVSRTITVFESWWWPSLKECRWRTSIMSGAKTSWCILLKWNCWRN